MEKWTWLPRSAAMTINPKSESLSLYFLTIRVSVLFYIFFNTLYVAYIFFNAFYVAYVLFNILYVANFFLDVSETRIMIKQRTSIPIKVTVDLCFCRDQ